jgi:hypothetical protein
MYGCETANEKIQGPRLALWRPTKVTAMHHTAVLLLIAALDAAHAIIQPLTSSSSTSSSSRSPEERVYQNILNKRLRPPAGALGPPAHLAP